MTFNLKIALLGLITMSAGVTLPACHSNKCCDKGGECAEACNETKVELKDVPPAVMATIQREAPGGTIREVEKCEMKGKTCYCAEVETGGKTWEMCIDADGTLTKKEMEH
ncbi:MAG: hypothetical protein JNK58_01860 [Phycisphaerae bacterium]|nr:hypothetical protein [Phycisphaerae bacterium]